MKDGCRYCRSYTYCTKVVKKDMCKDCISKDECNVGNVSPCEDCNFHDYMKLFGFEANSSNCPIDCSTLRNKNISDDIFAILLSNTLVDDVGNVLYIAKRGVMVS